jgi:hypothetical protein
VESCKLRYFNSCEFFDHTGYLVPRHRIDSNLAAEEQQILAAHIEIEDASIFQEKLAFLGNEDGKWVRLNCSWSTSVAEKSVFPVRFKTIFE